MYVYPPTSPERRACETPLQAPKQAASQPARQGSKAARQQGSKAARGEPGQPASQAARQQGSNLSSYRGLTFPPQAATGLHRMLDLEPPALLPLAFKSVLPTAQESQIAYFGCPAEPSANKMQEKANREQPRSAKASKSRPQPTF